MASDERRERRPRIAALATAACVSTVLTSGYGIAVLALAEHAEREAIEATSRLEAAVGGANAAARAFAEQTIAWKDLVFHEGDRREVARRRSAFASQSKRVVEALDLLVEQGVAAELPVDGIESAGRRVLEAQALLATRLAELRVDLEGARRAGDGFAEKRRLDLEVDLEVEPSVTQASFEIVQVAENWSRLAANRRADRARDEAERVRRLRAWFEILALVTSGLVLLTAIAAVAAPSTRRRAGSGESEAKPASGSASGSSPGPAA